MLHVSVRHAGDFAFFWIFQEEKTGVFRFDRRTRPLTR